MARKGSKGSHTGSLAGGFMQGLLASLRLGMQMQYYEAISKYYAGLSAQQNQGRDTLTAAGDKAGAAFDRRLAGPANGGAAVPVAGAAGDGKTPTTYGPAFVDAAGGGSVSMAALKEAVHSQETRGYSLQDSYSALGPPVPGRGRAIGRYQVMPENVPKWTKQVLGKEMTPEEFRANPEAQEKVFEGIMGGYVKQSGLIGAQKAWFGPGKSDRFTTQEQYRSGFLNAYQTALGKQEAAAPTATAAKPAAPTTTAAPAAAKSDPYALINDVDDQGRPGQKGKFAQWNNDPVGNSDKLLGTVHPDLQAIVKQAQADNPNLHFVVGLGKSTAQQQDQAKGWGWSQIGGNTQTPHMKGEAVDLWPVDDQGRVNFGDKSKQVEINKAMQDASKKLGLNLRWGGLQSEGGANKNFRDAPNFQILNPRPWDQAKPAAAPAAKPALPSLVGQPTPAAATPAAPAPAPAPAPATTETQAPDMLHSVIAAGQPISPAIPTSADASAAPTPELSDAETNRPIRMASTGYGPKGDWGPNPPLAERPKKLLDQTDGSAGDTGGDITPASNAPAMPTGPSAGPVPPPPPMMPDDGGGLGMAARRGGVVRRYQDGGEIQDPGATSVGMPPALAGGQQQVPPIYFNPATYAPAGAPVGKGISATSAPTFTAGAIPTLPMYRGGMVKGYDDGGFVDDGDESMPPVPGSMGAPPMPGASSAAPDAATAAIANIYRPSPTVPAPTSGQPPIATQADMSPVQTADYRPSDDSRPIQLASAAPFRMPSGGGGGLRMPMMGARRPPVGKAQPQPGVFDNPWGTSAPAPAAPSDDPSHPSHPDHPANDPNLPPHTPQIMDHEGNPSTGLIGAISSGMHLFGEMLGLVPGSHPAIAGDPNTQAERRNFASGQGVSGLPSYTDADDKAADETFDPHKQLTDNLRNIAKLDGVYTELMARGDPAGAAKVSAAIMYRSAQVSMKFGQKAIDDFYRNDLHGAVDNLKMAHDAIADGTLINASIIKDPNEPGGEAVIVAGQKLNGEQLWQQVVGPREVLQAATNAANGSTAWKMYEEAAGKYDPNYAQVMADRRAARSQAATEDKEARKQAAADTESQATLKVLQGMREPTDQAIPTGPAPVTRTESPTGPAAPAAPATAIAPTPAVAAGDVATASTAPTDTTGTAAVATAPPGSPTRPGIPPQPGVQPAAAAEPVSPEETHLTNTRDAALQRVWTEHGYDPYKGTFTDAPPAPRRPEDTPGYAEIKTPAGRLAAERAYHDNVAEWKQGITARKAAMDKEIATVNSDYTTQFTALKALQGQKAAAAGRVQAADLTATRQQEAEGRKLEEPMDPREETERFKDTPTMDVLANTPHVKFTPSGNATADAQARRNTLNDMYDLPDESAGGTRQGGQLRLAQLNRSLWNIQSANKYADKDQIGDFLVGFTQGAYGVTDPTGKPTVKRGGQDVIPLKIWYGKVDKSPSATMYVAPSDWEVMKSIRDEVVAYKSQPKQSAFPMYKGAIPPPGYEVPMSPPMQTPMGGT